MRGQDFLKLQCSKPLLANILWTDSSLILSGHAALKNRKNMAKRKQCSRLLQITQDGSSRKMTEDQHGREKETGNINCFEI